MSILTKRPLEAIDLYSRGKHAPEVAAEMGIAVSTVENHLKTVLSETRSRNRHGAIYKLIKLGEIAIQESEIPPASQKILLTTPRQREALSWLMTGSSTADIGAMLGIARTTAKNHLQDLYKAFEVTNQAHLIRPGVAGGVRAPDDDFDIGREEEKDKSNSSLKHQSEFLLQAYPGLNLDNLSDEQVSLLAWKVPELAVAHKDEMEQRGFITVDLQIARTNRYFEGVKPCEIAEEENAQAAKQLRRRLYFEEMIGSGKVSFGIGLLASELSKTVPCSRLVEEAHLSFNGAFPPGLLEEAASYVRG